MNLGQKARFLIFFAFYSASSFCLPNNALGKLIAACVPGLLAVNGAAESKTVPTLPPAKQVESSYREPIRDFLATRKRELIRRFQELKKDSGVRVWYLKDIQLEYAFMQKVEERMNLAAIAPHRSEVSYPQLFELAIEGAYRDILDLASTDSQL